MFSFFVCLEISLTLSKVAFLLQTAEHQAFSLSLSVSSLPTPMYRSRRAAPTLLSPNEKKDFYNRPGVPTLRQLRGEVVQAARLDRAPRAGRATRPTTVAHVGGSSFFHDFA